MFAYRVNFLNRGSAAEKHLRDQLLIREGDSINRHGQKSRAPSGNNRKDQIVRLSLLKKGLDPLGCFKSCFIRNRMTGFEAGGLFRLIPCPVLTTTIPSDNRSPTISSMASAIGPDALPAPTKKIRPVVRRSIFLIIFLPLTIRSSFPAFKRLLETASCGSTASNAALKIAMAFALILLSLKSSLGIHGPPRQL
jgi:hypothetical protein